MRIQVLQAAWKRRSVRWSATLLPWAAVVALAASILGGGFVIGWLLAGASVGLLIGARFILSDEHTRAEAVGGLTAVETAPMLAKLPWRR